MKCKECGGDLRHIDGLEGSWCIECDTHHDVELDKESPNVVIGKMFSEERIRSIRGVPTNRFSIGSETRGRIELNWPINSSREEIDTYIKENLDLYERIVDEVRNKRDLPVFTKR